MSARPKTLLTRGNPKILKGASKIIIDPSAKGAQGVVPYLPLPELKKNAGGAK